MSHVGGDVNTRGSRARVQGGVSRAPEDAVALRARCSLRDISIDVVAIRVKA